MKIITILGTRPEITKLSPLLPVLDREFNHLLIHTGQHYDYEMDEVFFEELNLRRPDYNLNIGSGSHASQVAAMMIRIEEILLQEEPDVVIVFADPNTPLAGALVAVKLHIPLIHLEAGCRSFNKKMPEEINRIVCDHCADLLLAPDETAKRNLLNENIPESKISVTGSLAIESSLRNVLISREKSTVLADLKLKPKEYLLATLHRAETTDDFRILKGVMESLENISKEIKIIFPLHPRTKKVLESNNYVSFAKNIIFTKPLGYLDFLQLLDNSLLVMSDSGGIQEEAAALNVPCLILREETEWTYLIDAGKNKLLGRDKDKIVITTLELLHNPAHLDNMKSVQLNLNTHVSQKIIDDIRTKFAE